MSHSPKTRDDDDRELDMIALRSAGMSSRLVGRQYGKTSASIRTITNRIRDDHADHTGEDVSGWW